MARLTALLGIALVALASGCASYGRPDFTKEPDPRTREFVLGRGDSVRIAVWKNPELTTETAIRPDGHITMPLVGDVVAGGKTPTELRADIQKRLAEFIKDESATVTVAILAVRSYSVTVAGNVERAGVYNAPPYLTINEALALAGGPNRFAGSYLILVRRDPNGAVRRLPIAHEDVQNGRDAAANLVLLPGDSLYVE